MKGIKKNTLGLSEDELQLINSPVGLKHLFANKKINVNKALAAAKYESELRRLQAELIKLQSWVIKNNEKVIIIFEGRDAAGKGGAIRRITAYINPRHFRKVALPKPTSEESSQWYFQRYVNKLPKAGEIVFFDRSWYNRAIVEPVNGFCSKEQYEIFMGQVNDFERMILESNIHLIKFYFSITKDEQARRFAEIKRNPLKRWKLTPVDAKAQELWDEYTAYKDLMFENTNAAQAPWIVINANQKTKARIQALSHILDNIPYEKEPEKNKID